MLPNVIFVLYLLMFSWLSGVSHLLCTSIAVDMAVLLNWVLYD